MFRFGGSQRVDVTDLVTDGQLLIASVIALAAGLVSFVSPCVLPLVPGYLAYVSASASSAGATSESGTLLTDARRTRRRMVLGALLFVAGFTAVFVAILSLAGSVGSWLIQWEDPITRIMGALIIVMGLVFIGAFGGMQRTTRLRLKPRLGLVGAPLLGAVFAIGWTPCIGPTLSVIGSLALQGGTAGRGAWLALMYSIGLGAPFILAAFGFGWMTTATNFFKRHIRTVNLIGGVLLIAIGVLMLSGVWIQIMYALQAVMSSFVPAL
ncbi:MAG: cytochrome c biogenesis CcdA family protein [Actinobacteria bacterium]|jgi:cytochrome c-type biogenesis protein|nr:cytochrome c biogenesis CcdA family protein [Actinomycetota bacterium]